MSKPTLPDSTISRRQHAEERRDQILDAAVQVFAEKGFGGASIRDIAAAVGVTEGLLYHYFEGKEQLMQACWKERSWRAHLERILASAGTKPLESVLRELVTDFMQTLSKNAPLVRMCAAESRRDPDLAAQHLAHIMDNHRLLTDFLRHRMAAGDMRSDADPDAAAGLLMGCAYSNFLLFGDSDSETWDQNVRFMAGSGVDTILRGIGR